MALAVPGGPVHPQIEGSPSRPPYPRKYGRKWPDVSPNSAPYGFIWALHRPFLVHAKKDAPPGRVGRVRWPQWREPTAKAQSDAGLGNCLGRCADAAQWECWWRCVGLSGLAARWHVRRGGVRRRSLVASTRQQRHRDVAKWLRLQPAKVAAVPRMATALKQQPPYQALTARGSKSAGLTERRTTSGVQPPPLVAISEYAVAEYGRALGDQRRLRLTV